MNLFWFLLGAGLGLVLGCEWDSSEDQSLDLTYSPHLGDPLNVTDAEECKTACCLLEGCDVAMVGGPQDGPLTCYLVTCRILGSDQCRLLNKSQSRSQVHRKRQEPGSESLIKPLFGEPKPERNEEKNQKDENGEIRCRLPMKVGSCRAAFPKFYYDVTNQSCRDFIYGGCEANANNFDSKEECETACKGVTGSFLPHDSTPPPNKRAPKALHASHSVESEGTFESEDTPKVISAEEFAELCEAEPDVGPCRAMFRHWYYDSKVGSCKGFTYGGCRGNKNNYVTKQSCMGTCTGVTVLPALQKSRVADDSEEHCLLMPDAGPCRAAFPMFFYDPSTDTCQSFIYGGCHGNRNRYSSKEDCMSRCSFDVGVKSGRAESRWTAGLFLFITLTAISALLLAALIIFTLKRRAFVHVPSSMSDKQELLPEADQLSVESLSIPDSPKVDQA
ncbi:kunitz-type serine protease inhibitor 6-like [Takifugu rubripes]|uniref:Kunitz-type serine protease inhibitor 6-like n=1 Tax=Takifugu rubripes TaxID=31033 RepID=A0A3B5K2J0_TAKRU|nr:kunitz-type serine protease inhibitor 6-like [Takifugu rubripes]|eukprot:XP_003979639.2 PREDICTED: kunitz-type serine protease inhibitor 6-like [Takifugu rubripes]